MRLNKFLAKIRERKELLKEKWAELTAHYDEEAIVDYIEACAIVCAKCRYNVPDEAYCMMCPVKFSRDKIFMEED